MGAPWFVLALLALALSVGAAHATVARSAGPNQLAIINANPIVDSVVVRDQLGNRISRLVPGTTTFVDIYTFDPDGFDDIDKIDVAIARGSASRVGSGVPEGGSFQWKRDPVSTWKRTSSAPSWQIMPGMCSIDTVTTSVSTQFVRFAVILSPIAHASSTGEWIVEVAVNHADDYLISGLDMAEKISLISLSPSGSFQPGPPGAAGLPLADPASGAIGVGVLSNAPWRFSGRTQRFVGVSDGTKFFDVLASNGRLRWATAAGGAASGAMDSAMAVLLDNRAASTSETPIAQDLTLSLTHAAGLGQQAYRADMDLRLSLLSGRDSISFTVPLTATVLSGGLPADSAVAEITPTNVVAGTLGQSFTVYLQIHARVANTGVDQLKIALPSGFGTPRVTLVRQGLVTLPFTDASAPGTAIAQLGFPITGSASLEVRFSTDVATQASSSGVLFGVVVDDSRTGAPGVAARAGDANLLVFSNRLTVTIAPAQVAFVNLAPRTATLFETQTFQFEAAPSDAFGNATSTVVLWGAEGGIGFVDATGRFTATATGNGRVIAKTSTLADTADVTVNPVPVISDVEAISIPVDSGALLPGGASAEMLRFRLRNRALTPDTLRTLSISDAAVGPGTISQMDESWSGLGLWRLPSGSGSAVSVRSAIFAGGVATLAGLSLAIPAGDSIELSIRSGASLAARDGDRLRVALGNSGAMGFSSGATPSGAWPFVTNGSLTVDGMSAAQVSIATLASGISVGSRRQPVASLFVPSNGYAADTLRRVNLLQLGDASPITDVPMLELWADDGSGLFEEGADVLLGALIWTGDRWERTGFTAPVPVPGRKFFVTADVSETAAEGVLLRLALPTLPDVALGMSSANSGPIDTWVVVPEPVVVSIADRITLTAVGLAGTAVAPGQRNVPVMALDLHNTFTDARSLTQLRVQNAVEGPGSLAQRDAELTRLELRDDANSNGVLDDPATDPVLATALLVDGRASFIGFSRAIGAGQTRRLFVTGGLSLNGAADGDRLAVSVASALDVTLEPASTMAAGWPLLSGSPPIVDGMVAAQIGLPGVPGVTLGPSDGPVEALGLVVPRNGYRDDILTGVRVENAGSATSGDVSELRLWLDGGDGFFDAGTADDRDLGPLARIGAEWRSPILSEPVGANGVRLHVSTLVSASPSDSVTLRLRVPLYGISMTSDNHGPRDVPIENPDDILLSTSPLLGSVSFSAAASTIGQTIQVRMLVRNVGAEAVTGVVPVFTGAEGTGTLTLLGGPAPTSADLAPGTDTVFVWTARADAAGSARLSGYAQGTGSGSGLPRRALVARSNAHQIYSSAADVSMFTVQSMPFAVNRGQADVVPLSLTFEHPGSSDASDIRVDGITLRLEDQSGAEVIPAALLSRISVVEGATTYLDRTSLETAGGAMLLSLVRPLIVTPGNPVTVAFHLDISDTTTVPDFRVVIPDSTGFATSDATSGVPVVVRLTGSSYPVRSGLARVLSGERELRVSATPETLRVSRGQAQVRLGVLQLRNAADPASGTDLRVGAVRFDLADSSGISRRNLDQAFARVSARTTLGTHADRAVLAADSTGILLVLTQVLTVPAGAALDLELRADLRAGAALGHYSAMLRDSSWIDTRDASSGDPIPVSLEAVPLEAGAVVVESPAGNMAARGIPRFPASAGVGRSALPAMDLLVRHPGTSGTSRMRLDSLDFELLDAARVRVAPGAYFDRVSILRRGVPISVQFSPPSTPALMTLPLSGLALEPGQIETLTVMVDLDGSAPTGSIELLLRDSGWHLEDANTSTGLAAVPEPGESMPFSSGVVRLDAPARRLEVAFESRLPAALPAGGEESLVALLRLANTAASGAGSIEVASLRLVAGEEGGASLAIGSVAQLLRAYVNGQLWATRALLTPDSLSATLVADSVLSVPAAGAVNVELRVVPRSGAGDVRFRFGLDRGDVGVVQPGSSLLSIAVEPANGGSFPFWTEYASVAGATLSASYANFPNPFAAGREPTSFVYALEQPARVSLRIWTLRGELVRTLLSEVPFGPGLRQSEQWDGRNGAGSLVVNGVYVAELVVQPEGAPSERILRKVAVLR